MSNSKTITRECFIKRLVDLCVRSGLAEFPKKHSAQHILLKSAVLILGQSDNFTESEINERLEYWTKNICQIEKFDHITLRRMLIDAGYLTRNRDGSCYQRALSEPQPGLFDETINQINILAVINSGREEIERRKKEYLAKSRM